MVPKICSIPECDRTNVIARGWCTKHYDRWRRHGDPTGGGPARPPVRTGNPVERFWKSVDQSGECWVWTGGKYSNGYGTHPIKGSGHLAHRFAYELLRGAIPEGAQIDHICHNRSCVNPSHLRPVTSKQNVENKNRVRSDNKYGYTGVGYNKQRGYYYAKVEHHGKRRTKSGFATPKEAGESARRMRNELFTHNDRDRVTV